MDDWEFVVAFQMLLGSRFQPAIVSSRPMSFLFPAPVYIAEVALQERRACLAFKLSALPL